jgi:O-antigen/teichoic acid export membrane protein
MRAFLKSRAEGLNGMIGHRGYRILKTGGWALTAKICAAINLFVCVPFVLEALGQRHFGAWAAVVSVITLSNFLDFGLGNGAMNLIAGAKGGNRPDQISGIIATAYASLLKTTAVLTLSFLAIPFLPWHRLLGLPVADAGISTVSVAIVLFAVLATIPLSLANKLQLGLGIGGKAFRWQAAGQLLTAGIVIFLAKSGYGLPALVAGSALVPLSALLMNTRELLKDLPKMDNPLHSDSLISKQIRHEGALFFILQLCAALAFSLDLLLITALSGAEQATGYSIVQRAFSLIPLSLGLFWVSLWPAYREALAANHHHWAFRIFKKSTLLAAAYAACFGILIAMLFEQITQLWIGHTINASITLILGFALWHVLEAIGTSIAMLLNAASIVRYQVVIGLIFAFTCLTAKVLILHHMSPDLLPWGTFLCYLLLNFWPVFLLRNKIESMISEKQY